MQRDTRGLWGKRLRWIAGLSVAGLSLWILIRDVEWPAVGQALETANYRWVVVGLVAIVGTFFTRTMRWRLLLWQFDVPLRPAMTALLNG